MPQVRSVSSAQQRLRRSNAMIAVMRASLARTERMSAGELCAYQERRLRALVRWAARRTPFYRRWFAEARVDPAAIRTLADLERLPLIDRTHLAERPEDFLAYPRRAVWAAHSSGTSGTPVTVYRTAGSSMFEIAALQRQWDWFGIRPGSPAVELRGSTFAGNDPGVVALRIPGADRLLVSSFRLSKRFFPAIWREITDYGPAVVEGWPSSLALLAALIRDEGLTLPVRGVITSSELMSAAQIALMRQVYVGPVIDHYGQTERVVMAGGCEAGGYHVFSDYGIMELLPVPGIRGEHEIVGTPLHNWGFPLLRYRTGDRMGTPPSEPCPCGRAFPPFGLIGGRAEDLVRAADGRPVPLASTIIDDLTGLKEVQFVQHRPGVFELRMVPGAGYDRAAVEALARENMLLMAGPGSEMTFTEIEALPRSKSGKLKTILVLDPGEQPEQLRSAAER
jgi:phenylacetate-CoA ligase